MLEFSFSRIYKDLQKDLKIFNVRYEIAYLHCIDNISVE